jgi:hypothetical protein
MELSINGVRGLDLDKPYDLSYYSYNGVWVVFFPKSEFGLRWWVTMAGLQLGFTKCFACHVGIILQTLKDSGLKVRKVRRPVVSEEELQALHDALKLEAKKRFS